LRNTPTRLASILDTGEAPVGHLYELVPVKMRLIFELCDFFSHYRVTETHFFESGYDDLIILDISLSLNQFFDGDSSFFKHSLVYAEQDTATCFTQLPDFPVKDPDCFSNFFVLEEIRDGKVEAWLLKTITDQEL
jgi:hypothetical protein